MKIKAGLILLASMLPLSAGTVTWVDWTSATGTGGSTSDTVKGTLSLSTPVNVLYTGSYAFAQTSGGSDYWNPSGPYLSATVSNAPDTGGSTDIIALSDVSSRTISFSLPVSNLFFAVVSLNGNGYVFDHDFTILSDSTSTPGAYGFGTLAKTNLGGGLFRLDGASGEPHGVIEFAGTVSAVTWSTATPEFWNGFTVGVTDLAPASSVPEPATWVLSAAGFGLVAIRMFRRRARR